MRGLIERAAAIMDELAEIHGPGTPARDIYGTFAVLIGGCVLGVMIFVVTGG